MASRIPDEDEADVEAVASQVLGAVPHPTAFRLADVEDMRATYANEFGGLVLEACNISQDWPDPNGNEWGEDHPFNIALTWAWEFEQELAAATTFGGQIRAVENHIVRLSDAAADTETYKKPQRDYFVLLAEFHEPALELLRGHEARTEPLEWLAERVSDITRMIDDVNDPKAFFALRPTEAAFGLPLVAEDRSEAALADLKTSLFSALGGRAQGGPRLPRVRPPAAGAAAALERGAGARHGRQRLAVERPRRHHQ